MQRTLLFWPALAVAAFAALIVAISPVAPMISARLTHPCIYLVGGVWALLFLRMLIDPKCRRGVYAVSIEYQKLRKPGWFIPGMGPGFLDPQWGLFGSRGGPPALLWVRVVLIAESILAAAFDHPRNMGDVGALAFAGFLLTIALSLVQAGLNAPTSES